MIETLSILSIITLSITIYLFQKFNELKFIKLNEKNTKNEGDIIWLIAKVNKLCKLIGLEERFNKLENESKEIFNSFDKQKFDFWYGYLESITKHEEEMNNKLKALEKKIGDMNNKLDCTFYP